LTESPNFGKAGLAKGRTFFAMGKISKIFDLKIHGQLPITRISSLPTQNHEVML